ncbi:MAG: hypothetical protein V8R75_04745 [Oscillospiraceae bacterium]
MSNQDPKIEEGLTGVPASGEEFSLEEILAEYGGSLEQVLLRETEEATGEEAASREASALPTPTPPAAEKQTVPSPAAQAAAPAPKESAPEESAGEPEIPPPPHPITLEDVVGVTVDTVMEEGRREPFLSPRRSLFSRRPLEETEELPSAPELEPEPEPETIGPEEEPREAAEEYRRSLAQPPCVTAAGISGGFDCCCAVGCGAIRSVTPYLERQFTGSESLSWPVS